MAAVYPTRHSPAQIFASLIVGEGFATLPSAGSSWPIYVSREPDSPDNVMSVFDTPGQNFGFDQFSGEGQDHPGVMIRFRSADYETGWVKAAAVKQELDIGIYRRAVVIDGITYTIASVTRRGDVNSLGSDGPNGKRRLFSLNATMVFNKIQS